MTLKVRLQGGPFEGERKTCEEEELVERIWVTRCVNCGSHWHAEEVKGAEVYRRDASEDDWVIYVFCDEGLGRRRPYGQATVKTPSRELVPA
jgi:hypothetical protein